MIVLKLLYIALLAVFLIDYSGFIQSLENGLKKWLKMPIAPHIPKPFSCSLCSTWWVCLIYLLIVGKFTLEYIALSALMAALTPVFHSAIVFVEGLLNKIIIVLMDWFKI